MRYFKFTCPYCSGEIHLNHFDYDLITNGFKCIMCDTFIENWDESCILVDDSVIWNNYCYIDSESNGFKWHKDIPIAPYMSEKDLRILVKHNIITEKECEEYLEKWRMDTRKLIALLCSSHKFEKERQMRIENNDNSPIEDLRCRPLPVFYLEEKLIFKPYPIDEGTISMMPHRLLIISKNIIEDFCNCKKLKYTSTNILDHSIYSSHQGKIKEFYSFIFNIDNKFELKCFDDDDPSIFGILSYQGYNYAFCIDTVYNLYVVPDNRYIKTGKHIPCIEMDDYS